MTSRNNYSPSLFPSSRPRNVDNALNKSEVHVHGNAIWRGTHDEHVSLNDHDLAHLHCLQDDYFKVEGPASRKRLQDTYDELFQWVTYGLSSDGKLARNEKLADSDDRHNVWMGDGNAGERSEDLSSNAGSTSLCVDERRTPDSDTLSSQLSLTSFDPCLSPKGEEYNILLMDDVNTCDLVADIVQRLTKEYNTPECGSQSCGLMEPTPSDVDDLERHNDIKKPSRCLSTVSDEQTCSIREATLPLPVSSYISPALAITPATPSDDFLESPSLAEAGAPCYDRKGKQRCSESRREPSMVANAAVTSGVTRGKQECTTDNCAGRETSNNLVAALEARSQIRQSPLPKISHLFDVDFLLHKFAFESVFSDDHLWPCPFPRTATIGDRCHKSMVVTDLLQHVRDHVKKFTEVHPGETLQCPLSNNSRCAWQGNRKNQALRISPNDGLGRHILDAHYAARSICCPCGSKFARDTRDQVVRHLDTSAHRKKMAEKRDKGRHFADYPDIRDPDLVKQQQEWKQGMSGGIVKDDREEGSSSGRKRARHF